MSLKVEPSVKSQAATTTTNAADTPSKAKKEKSKPAQVSEEILARQKLESEASQKLDQSFTCIQSQLDELCMRGYFEMADSIWTRISDLYRFSIWSKFVTSPGYQTVILSKPLDDFVAKIDDPELRAHILARAKQRESMALDRHINPFPHGTIGGEVQLSDEDRKKLTDLAELSCPTDDTALKLNPQTSGEEAEQAKIKWEQYLKGIIKEIVTSNDPDFTQKSLAAIHTFHREGSGENTPTATDTSSSSSSSSSASSSSSSSSSASLLSSSSSTVSQLRSVTAL